MEDMLAWMDEGGQVTAAIPCQNHFLVDIQIISASSFFLNARVFE